MIENRNFLCQAFTIQVVNFIFLITKQGPMGLNSYEYLSVFVFVDVCSHRAISTKINVLCYKGIEKCSLICTYDLCKHVDNGPFHFVSTEVTTPARKHFCQQKEELSRQIFHFQS